MTRQKACVAAIIASTAFASSSGVHAQDNYKVLGEREIRAAVVSKDITDGSHWSIYLRPDGALIGSESGSRWTGTWNIQKSKLCIANPGSKALDCYDVWMSGAYISLRLNKDDDSFVGLIEKHKAN